MENNKVTMSIRGYEDKLERYREISTVTRKEIIARIQEARSHGDLSENAEYTSARDAQGMNEGEIGQLEYEIKNADVQMTASEKKDAETAVRYRETEGKNKLLAEKADLEARQAAAVREGNVSERDALDWEIAKADMRIGNNEYVIEMMKEMLRNGVVVDDFATAAVRLGSSVVVYDTEFDEEDTYTIVGSSETNALENKISKESPIGMAIMGKKSGDTVTVKAPDGEYELVIRKIF